MVIFLITINDFPEFIINFPIYGSFELFLIKRLSYLSIMFYGEVFGVLMAGVSQCLEFGDLVIIHLNLIFGNTRSEQSVPVKLNSLVITF